MKTALFLATLSFLLSLLSSPSPFLPLSLALLLPSSPFSFLSLSFLLPILPSPYPSFSLPSPPSPLPSDTSPSHATLNSLYSNWKPWYLNVNIMLECEDGLDKYRCLESGAP